MIEYLIRAAEGSDWDLHLPPPRLEPVLLPKGMDARPIDGWGHLRFALAGCEVALAAEDPGWQVSFEGPISQEDAAAVVGTIASQLERATGVPTRVVQIGGWYD